MNNFKTPMLAHKTDPKRIDFAKHDYYVQPKLDGIRCYITKDGMFTRNHKDIVSAPHIFEGLQDFFAANPEVILDGELYNHELKDNFSKIVSLVRKTKPSEEALEESREMVEFHCYDCFITDQPNLIFSDRDSFLKRNFGRPFEAKVPKLYTVETEPATDTEQMISLDQCFCSEGYEGSMIRQDAEYQPKRSWYLQKVKTFVDEEFEIVGFVERVSRSRNGVAHEEYKTGMLGKFIMKMADGREFGAPPGKGYDHKKLTEMWENRDSYIGQQATVEFFEYTEYGVPRFPKYKALRNYE